MRSLHGRSPSPFRLLCLTSSGSTATAFALLLVPLLLGVGAALDYGRAVGLQTLAMKAADAAALAALSPNASEQKRQEAAEDAFRSNLAVLKADPDNVRLKKLHVKLTRDQTTADVTCELEVRLRLAKLLSPKGWTSVGCDAQATKGAPDRLDLYVIADNSLSMTRPMDPMLEPPADQGGCRFACHTTAQELKSRNIQSRYGAGAAMIAKLVDSLPSDDATYTLYTAAASLELQVGPTRSRPTFKTALESVAFSGDSRGSHLGALFKPFADKIANAPADRRRIVVVLGDGQEEWRNADLKWPLSRDPSGDPVWLGAPDGTGKAVRGTDFPDGYVPPPTQFLETCAALKNKGFTIYTIYTPTQGTTVNTDPAPLSPDAIPEWRAPFSHQLNEPASRRAFEACASPGGFMPATNPAEMTRIADDIVRRYSQLRISR